MPQRRGPGQAFFKLPEQMQDVPVIVSDGFYLGIFEPVQLFQVKFSPVQGTQDYPAAFSSEITGGKFRFIHNWRQAFLKSVFNTRFF